MSELDAVRLLFPETAPAPAEARPRTRAILVAHIADSVASRRLRPCAWWSLPAVGVAAAAIAAALFLVGGRNGNGNAAAATVLRKAAAFARQQEPTSLGPGQYLYVKSINAYLSTTVDKGKSFAVLLPNVREVWIGRDDGRVHETTGQPKFLSARDRETWIAAGRPPLRGAVGDAPLGPLRPLDLPTDPDELFTRLKHEANGFGARMYPEMFVLVGDALRETNVSPAQRAALYEVAARIPGVELVGQVTDSIGRPGIAVAMADPKNRLRQTLIFDPESWALLGEEEVTLDGNSFGYPDGTVIGHATYVASGVVDSIRARPR